MNFDLHALLKSKQAVRERLAAMPISEKLQLLEVLRERSLALTAARPLTSQQGNRQTFAPDARPQRAEAIADKLD